MVGILAVSGPPPTPRATATPSPAAMAVDPNQQRIEDYQRRIQEQAQRLAAEQAQLQLTKDAARREPRAATVGAAPRRSVADASAPTATRVRRARRARGPRPRRRQRRLLAAGHHRRGDTAAPAASAPVDRSARRDAPAGVAAAHRTCPVVPGAAPAPTPPAATPRRPRPRRVSPRRRPSGEPRYTLFEGTIIETVLTNRLDGTFSGPVNCLVSVPVYAADHLVIPAGARVLGEARAVNTFGQSRLAVTFHRVILPNGAHVDLDDVPRPQPGRRPRPARPGGSPLRADLRRVARPRGDRRLRARAEQRRPRRHGASTPIARARPPASRSRARACSIGF